MADFQLSETAVAVLRFRLKGYRMPLTECRRSAFEELAAAGLLEPDGCEYRLVDQAIAAEVLREQEELIEQNRHEPPDDDLTLSEEAASLLSQIVSGEQLEVTDGNRPAFRELEAARIVVLGHSFSGGRDSTYRLTYWGRERGHELTGRATGPLPARYVSLRR
jgi:AcrR family transcriptional regulator